VSNRTENRIGTRECFAFNNQMPRYFFHILHPICEPILDEEGGEFNDFETAKQVAVDSLRDLAVESFKQGRYAHSLALQIMDESGTVLETLNARETFA
jgi:hypothetical protein